jgi:hypothetical protein
MKKLLIIIMLFLVLLTIATPVYAKGGGQTGQPGEPPGWSHENPGQGGSAKPGPGGGDIIGPMHLALW